MDKSANKMNVLSEDAGNVKREKVRVVPITAIDDAPNHPFQIRDDEEMASLVESIAHYGVMSPCLVRHKPDDRYELIAGHRRKYASIRNGIGVLPIIIRDCDEDEAIIAMVDSNLQRERILPSEKAFAYKMKAEALNRQGKRTDLTSTPVVSKLRTSEKIGRENGESREQVRRYIRLTYLVSELLEDVDRQKIAIRPAVELSYLTTEEQIDVSYVIDTEEATPSLAQAIQMRALSKEGKLDVEAITEILSTKKPNQIEKLKIPMQKFEKYFRSGTSQNEMVSVIFAALDEYYKKRQKKVTK